ncbi:MBOAT family protein [Ihubacter sp. mB4P-1]
MTFGLYCLLPGIRAKNFLLILASLVFYAFGEPFYVIVMALSAAANYLFGLYASRKGLAGRISIFLAVIFNLSVISIFKYADFAVEVANRILLTEFPQPGIPLPVGISFFTFQALSYVIDAYREESAAAKRFSDVLLYICFFPQLVAGPIIKYSDIQGELSKRRMDSKEIAEGIRRFICGLSKKLLIANTMGSAADVIFALQEVNLPLAWFGAVTYLFQIYFDFSGYSDMAIGLGKMFGFHYKENFNYPYISSSIKEFWRRWHISLSTWFKEYVYIPLGGNQKGRMRTYINKYIVFFVTGLWHGASWTFVIWGLFHGTFSVIEETGILPERKIKGRCVGHVYTMLIVIVGFVMFRAESIGQGFYFVKEMFLGFHWEFALKQALLLQLTPKVLLVLLAAVIFSMPVRVWVQKLFKRRKDGERFYETVAYVGSLAFLLLCILNLSSGTFNPFIYFRF